MKAIRVLVLVLMGVSAFSGFAQEVAPSAGAPAAGAVVLNRTKLAPEKQEIVSADKYPFAALQKALEKGPGAEIGAAAASISQLSLTSSRKTIPTELSAWAGMTG